MRDADARVSNWALSRNSCEQGDVVSQFIACI